MRTQFTRLGLLLASVLAIGCGGKTDSRLGTEPPAKAVPKVGARFDPSTTGTVRGKVTWTGEVPSPQKLMAAIPQPPGYRYAEMPNPFAPQVHPQNRGLFEAVVFLEGVNPELAKPWPARDLLLEMSDFRFRFKQPDGTGRRSAFVPLGGEVSFVSKDPIHHTLRARGAAFFALPFPEPEKPLHRKFDRPGLVELTSGSGYHWAAADLYVCDHPYYVLTAEDGSFEFPAVPPGSYTLVVRVRNWNYHGRERDPESGLIFRLLFAPSLEKRIPVTVVNGVAATVNASASTSDFPIR